MIVYYFTSAKYGIENLKNRRLKVSDFSNVNDPFELLGIELRDKVVRKAVNFEKSQISERYGLLCFSTDKYNPVQWAHYAENHKGVCLGFDIPEKKLKKVKYVAERLARETLDQPDCNEKLLTTKFNHWSYEQERRLIIDLNSNKINGGGLRFESFSDEMVLKEVYIGCKSALTFADISSAYKSGNKSVITKVTRPSFRDFRIVWDRSKKSERT
ncbi:DUF2971 domain-containing protein [Alteromonas sp. OM2203]|uniref:DUF2971 domain-containing protein n=1 Tax=Alteromonas sp. OM2203 TaxID=3398817 RepID=UPI003AF3E3E8